MSETINDPDLYARMNTGHPTIKEARKALKDFTDEVQLLREKYLIRDMVVLVGAVATVEDERLYLSSAGFRGTAIAALRMLAPFAEQLAEDHKNASEKDSE
jgi:hypothetical protein